MEFLELQCLVDDLNDCQYFFILNILFDEVDFPHKLLLTNTQLSRLCRASANGSFAKIKLSKTQLNKIEQSGGYLGRILGPLLKTGLLFMKNILKPLAKSVLIQLRLTAAASAADAVINEKIFGRHDEINNFQ